MCNFYVRQPQKSPNILLAKSTGTTAVKFVAKVADFVSAVFIFFQILYLHPCPAHVAVYILARISPRSQGLSKILNLSRENNDIKSGANNKPMAATKECLSADMISKNKPMAAKKECLSLSADMTCGLGTLLWSVFSPLCGSFNKYACFCGICQHRFTKLALCIPTRHHRKSPSRLCLLHIFIFPLACFLLLVSPGWPPKS